MNVLSAKKRRQIGHENEGVLGCRPAAGDPMSQFVHGKDDLGPHVREASLSRAQHGLGVRHQRFLKEHEEARRGGGGNDSHGVRSGGANDEGRSAEWDDVFAWAHGKYLANVAGGEYCKKSWPQALDHHNTFENFILGAVDPEHAAYKRVIAMGEQGRMEDPWEEETLVTVVIWIVSPPDEFATLSNGVQVRRACLKLRYDPREFQRCVSLGLLLTMQGSAAPIHAWS
jgi:hypothetical protein